MVAMGLKYSRFHLMEVFAAIVNIKVIHWPSKTDPLALV
jgi:hypothetical protein